MRKRNHSTVAYIVYVACFAWPGADDMRLGVSLLSVSTISILGVPTNNTHVTEAAADTAHVARALGHVEQFNLQKIKYC
jgi:hypothetical protein